MTPFTKIFQYDTNSEKIFHNAVEIIKDRLARNLRININEVLVVYCAYIVGEIRDGKPISLIEKNAARIFSPDKVMIGVPESMRKITFQATIDGEPAKEIIFNEPIPITDYIFAPK